MPTDARNDLIVRSEEPPNLEMPFARLEQHITPNEQFYVRCHFPIPALERARWKLTIEGPGNSPVELTYADLERMPRHSITATMECAGNGRSFLEPKVKGVAWEIGAVGNAEWSGVLLREVLDWARCGDQGHVILEGADRGSIKEGPRPTGEINYARSLPMAKARGDVLLALEMNGAALTPAHGFPVRAVVPGWFGMASVKWLQRIILSDRPGAGYFESIDYTYWEERAGLTELVPLREMQVKAQIARPAMNEVVPGKTVYRVHGAAWAAEEEVAQVEVSVDGGRTWAAAALLGQPVRHAWRFWEFSWMPPSHPARCTLIARATDAAGRTQPRARVAGYGSYMVNHWLPITVEVR